MNHKAIYFWALACVWLVLPKSMFAQSATYTFPNTYIPPEYVSGGWPKETGIQQINDGGGPMLLVTQNASLLTNRMLGLYFPAPSGTTISHLEFTFDTNFDMNSLVAGLDYPSHTLAWRASAVGPNQTASIDLPNVPWVAFGLFSAQNTVVPFNNWHFRVKNVRITYKQGNEFNLVSTDGKVKVVLDAKFGGAVTKIYDNVNFPGLNLINDSQAGAMFQSAFWLLPRHTELPQGCMPNEQGNPDQWNDNPTQAGYVADGLAGNPIGILGVNQNIPDPAEFIRFEDNGKTVHFKSRYIRYDYCAYGDTPIDKRNLWDTNFYIEQWASLSSIYSNTLVLKSKLTYQGEGSREIMSGGGMQGIYAFHLPRSGYYVGGQKIIDSSTGWDHPLKPIPDKNWAAIIGASSEAGIGMVYSPFGKETLGAGRFNFGIRSASGVSGMDTSIIYPLGAGADYATVGNMTNVIVRSEPRVVYGENKYTYHYTFNNTSSFEWSMYFPIGTLNQIKTASEAILADPTLFGFEPANQFDLDKDGILSDSDFTLFKQYYGSKDKIIDFNQDGVVNILDFGAFSREYLKR